MSNSPCYQRVMHFLDKSALEDPPFDFKCLRPDYGAKQRFRKKGITDEVDPELVTVGKILISFYLPPPP